ncbi:MAG: hypothetical protein D6755_05815 [Anaerolineae bacterium]|nr:MAG: hypothetical protein D6755_05815 [Anaerolineae bacterium]
MNVPRRLLLLLLLLLPACRGTASRPKTALLVQLNGQHGTQFAGYYQAVEQGYYAARGLEVSFVEGGMTQNGYVNPTTLLRSEEAPFAVLTFGEYQEIAQTSPTPLVVMGLFQISPVVLISLHESEIRTLQDTRGKRVAIFSEPESKIVHRALHNVDMQPQDIREVRLQNPSLENFYKQRVDVWAGSLLDEAVTAQLDGYRLNLIFPADYGANTYEGLLVTTQEYAETHPAVVMDFVEATIQGWRYALENPKETTAVLQKWNPAHSSLYYELGLDYLRPLVDTGEIPLGWIDYNRWRLAFDSPPPPDSPGYDMRYVEAAHTQE